MRSRQQPLSKFKHVALRRETWHGPRRSRTVYTVRLATHGDPVLVDSFRAYPDARRLAEELSVFCELKLSDDTSGKMVVREHGTLDWSLRQRQQDRRAETGRRKRPDSPLSKYPCNAVAESQTADGQVVFELPHRISLAPGRVSLIAAVLLGVWIAFAARDSFRVAGDPGQSLALDL